MAFTYDEVRKAYLPDDWSEHLDRMKRQALWQSFQKGAAIVRPANGFFAKPDYSAQAIVQAKPEPPAPVVLPASPDPDHIWNMLVLAAKSSRE